MSLRISSSPSSENVMLGIWAAAPLCTLTSWHSIENCFIHKAACCQLMLAISAEAVVLGLTNSLSSALFLESMLLDCAHAPSLWWCSSATLINSSLKFFSATNLEAFYFSCFRACWISWCGTFSPACSNCEAALYCHIFFYFLVELMLIHLKETLLCSH